MLLGHHWFRVAVRIVRVFWFLAMLGLSKVQGTMGFRACVAVVGWIPATILNIVLPASLLQVDPG